MPNFVVFRVPAHAVSFNSNELYIRPPQGQQRLTCSFLEPEDSNSNRIFAHSVDQGIIRSSNAMSKATFSNGTSSTGMVNRTGARVVQKVSSSGKDADFAELISSRSRAKVLKRTAEKGFSVARSFTHAH